MILPEQGLGCEVIAEATYRKTAGIGLEHAQANLPYLRRTIADLEGVSPERPSAIVLCAGPSLHRHPTAEFLKASGYPDHGVLVATDGALGYCLRNDLIPDFVVSVDPHPTRIIRWFGDPDLAKRPDDDYFHRQDLDPYFHQEEHKRNQELLELVNHHGSKIRAVLATSVSPALTRRVQEAGMPIYWWNPIYDDFDEPRSVTRRLFEMNRVPCMVAGGNCGTAAWVFAGSILKKETVALVGMDLSYAPGTPLSSTQYYSELRDLFAERAEEAYRKVWNPHLKEMWYTDPAYWWYRESFLEMARQASWATHNCTQGGILFGEGIHWQSPEQFLAQSCPTPRPVA